MQQNIAKLISWVHHEVCHAATKLMDIFYNERLDIIKDIEAL